jgi:hypothetical protein
MRTIWNVWNDIGTERSNGTIETAGTVGTGLKITLNLEPLSFELP